jgi:hypothetical protein
MKIKFLPVFSFLVILIQTNCVSKSDTVKDINAVSIKSGSTSAEEWKNPGIYSPVKAFDGKTDTCAAEGDKRNWFYIEVVFEKKVDIDEIRIMNGSGKSEELFKKNNRVGKLSVSFNSGTKVLKEETVILKDQREFQSVRLAESYKIDKILFSAWGGGEFL